MYRYGQKIPGLSQVKVIFFSVFAFQWQSEFVLSGLTLASLSPPCGPIICQLRSNGESQLNVLCGTCSSTLEQTTYWSDRGINYPIKTRADRKSWRLMNGWLSCITCVYQVITSIFNVWLSLAITQSLVSTEYFVLPGPPDEALKGFLQIWNAPNVHICLSYLTPTRMRMSLSSTNGKQLSTRQKYYNSVCTSTDSKQAVDDNGNSTAVYILSLSLLIIFFIFYQEFILL